MELERVISGGQTGGDRAALAAPNVAGNTERTSPGLEVFPAEVFRELASK